MTKKDLEKHISELSVEEKKLRDLYLRDLSNGTLQGPLTGYASIDKPWLKYSRPQDITCDFEDMSIYQLMKKQNINHKSDIAINYFGNRISYGKMLGIIDDIAKSMKAMGINKGDTIMMIMANTPEAEFIFYAANKIGVTLCSIDPRSNMEAIISDIKEFNIKQVFCLDVINDKFDTILKEGNVKNIISISPYISLPAGLNTIAMIKNKKKTNNSNQIIEWKKFIDLGKKKNIDIEEVYEKGSTAVIVHTGGSTGTPKGVRLSNESFNSLVYQHFNSKMQFNRQEKFLNLLPPFIAFGLNNSLHLSACEGFESILIPYFEPEDFPKLIKKNKPNIIMGGPIHFNILSKSKIFKSDELSYLKICVVGGDKMPLELQRDSQDFLKNHGSNALLWLGYGATETSSATCCVIDECFKYETVGAPFIKNNFKLYDSEKDEEICGYNKIGEIRISGPTIMQGYTGSFKSENDDVIILDEFGNKWYNTGDLGHFDEDGLLYIDGRIKRIITRRGFKIYPAHVEKLIMHNPAVKQCAVVGIKDDEELNIPVANIVIKDEYKNLINIEDDIISQLDSEILSAFPEYTVMAGYNFIDEMPLTPIGKVDYKKLESYGIIDVDKKGKRLQKIFK